MDTLGINIKSVELTTEREPLSPSDKNAYQNQIQEICTNLRKEFTDGKEKVKALEHFVYVAKMLKDEISLLEMNENIVTTLRLCLVHRSSYIRSSTIRCIRYCVKDITLLTLFWKHCCHFFIAKVYDLDKKFEKEKKQVLELMRTLSKTEEQARITPPILLRGLVMIADTVDDPMRLTVLEILRDFTLVAPQLMAQVNGIKSLINSLLDPKAKELSESIVHTILYLSDQETCRKFLRLQYDIQYVFSALTDYTVSLSNLQNQISNLDKNNPQQQQQLTTLNQQLETMRTQWQLAKQVITAMMKSWNGAFLISNTSPDCSSGLASIVRALKLPGENNERRHMLLDLLIDILKAASPHMYHEYIPALSTDKKETNNAISHMNVLKTQKTLDVAIQQHEALHYNVPQGDNILLVYLALIIKSFIYHGMVECLMDLSKWSHETVISNRASQILQVILLFADLLLDPSECLKLHQRFDSELATQLEDEKSQQHYSQLPKGVKTLSEVTAYVRSTRKVYKTKPIKMENVKIQVGLAMDESQFNQLIRDSQVLVYKLKDWQKWNWNVVTTMILGPLRLPIRMQEALKTKFIKRLIGFFKPMKKLFSDMQYMENYKKIGQLGCLLFENLLASDFGCAFLQTVGFLEQINQALQIEIANTLSTNGMPSMGSIGNSMNQMNSVNATTTTATMNTNGSNTPSTPNSGISNSMNNFKKMESSLFSKEKITYSMAREYFTFLGTFSRFAQGVRMLEKANIFKALQQLITMRDDICQLTIRHLDYGHTDPSICNFSRDILKAALTSDVMRIRYFSTIRMRQLLRENIEDFHVWGIKLLNSQISASWDEVSKDALRILCSACSISNENLDEFINQKPLAVDALEKQSDGRRILLQMLSRKNGFEYLNEIGWVKRTMVEWRESRNKEYVEKAELYMAKAITDPKNIVKRTGLSFIVVSDEGVCLPPHFYGELSKTERGCELIAQSNDMEHFLQILYSDSSSFLDRRVALWTLGQIASSNVGYSNLLSKTDIIAKVCDFAIQSTSLSFRGTCILVLSLMAKSELVRQCLIQLHWSCKYDETSKTSVALPVDPTALFTIPQTLYEGSSTYLLDPYLRSNLDDEAKGESELTQNIVKQLSLLANPVTEMAATKQLKKFKLTNPEEFKNPYNAFRIFLLLSKYKYSFRTKKLLHMELYDNVEYSQEALSWLDANFSNK